MTVVGVVCLLAACNPDDDAAARPSPPRPSASAPVPTRVGAAPPDFATLPAVDSFTYPTGRDDVVMQIAVRAPSGPDVPLLTVYGNGDVVAGTSDGWRTGTISDLEVQGLLDDAESVGLLDDPLVLRSPGATTTAATATADATVPGRPVGPDFTLRFDVDGRTLEHQLDLARIERPPAIWAFMNGVITANRFDLTRSFEPDAWVACTVDGCRLVPTALDATSRPVLRHEDADRLLAP